MTLPAIEIVPAVLRKTFEGLEEDWNKVVAAATHIQIDITDGVFAGDGTVRDIRRFKQLAQSEKAELHMMVHNPGHYIDDIIDVNPARCAFHVEAFADGGHIDTVYKKLREGTSSELGLAINPTTPNEWVEEQLSLIDYVLFLGVHPGWGGQDIQPEVFRKIGAWRAAHPDLPIAADGHVNKETIGDFVRAGARILCTNSAIFGGGDPNENITQLRLLAEQAILESL